MRMERQEKLLSLLVVVCMAGVMLGACTGEPVETREDVMPEGYSRGESPGHRALEHEDVLMHSDEGQEQTEESTGKKTGGNPGEP